MLTLYPVGTPDSTYQGLHGVPVTDAPAWPRTRGVALLRVNGVILGYLLSVLYRVGITGHATETLEFVSVIGVIRYVVVMFLGVLHSRLIRRRCESSMTAPHVRHCRIRGNLSLVGFMFGALYGFPPTRE